MKINRSFLLLILIGLLVFGFGLVINACTPTISDDDDGCSTKPCNTSADCGGYICMYGCCSNMPVEDDDDDDDDDSSDDDSSDDDDDDDDDDNGDPTGTWTDPTTGLMWQVESSSQTKYWADSKDYCNSLNFAGYDNWHLPTISELRSLIRGCADTETGGVCGATDDCLSSECWNYYCAGCYAGGGPSSSGCYWPSQIQGGCSGLDGWYWSSSSVEDLPGHAFAVVFFMGGVQRAGKTSYENPVRCVR